MSQSRRLIVATLMPPEGETGVQSHFRAIVHEAEKLGIETALLHPYSSKLSIARKSLGLVARLIKIFSKERFVIWNRWSHYYLLRYQLKWTLCSDDKESVIYAQDPLSSRAALNLGVKRLRVVSVVHFNISEAQEAMTKGLTKENGPLYRHFSNIDCFTLPKVDKIIFVSQFMQVQVNERLPALRTVKQAVIPNFIQDKLRFQNPTIKGDLICVGTLETRKNQAFVLRVLAKAHTKGHRYQLTIIGDGPDRRMLEKLAAELNLSESVTFLGFKANAADYMSGHRVYVHGALMENFGITFLEALSHGLPILAPPVGGIPEVFIDGEQGYFWPLDDIDDAARKLCHILENEPIREKLSLKARERFVSCFSEKALSEAWLRAIFDV